MARYTKSYTETDFYKYYIDATTDVYHISKKTYKQILLEFLKIIQTRVIEESRIVRLPYRVGSICIVKKKPKSWKTSPKSFDYQACKIYGTRVYHLNEHSDGYKYRFYWNKQDCNFKNKGMYQMKWSRDNKRRLAQIIKNKETDYIEI